MAGSGLRALAGRRPIRLRLTLTYSVLFVLARAVNHRSGAVETEW